MERENETTTSISIGFTAAGPLVRMTEHEVPAPVPFRCTTYVTSGLGDLGHPELVFTLRTDRGAGPAFALEPLDLLRLLHWKLAHGGRLSAGTLVGEAVARAVAWPSLAGFAVERAWPIDGVDVPPGALALIALFGAEYDVAEAFGASRVLARLAAATRAFPTALWCDVAREHLAHPDERSRLERASVVHLPGITATRESGVLRVRVPRAVRPALARAHDGVRGPFALLCGLDPGADGRLAWMPGQRDARGVAAPGGAAERVGGNFVAFVEGRPCDEGGVVEDGFVSLLTHASARRLRAAVGEGSPLVLPTAGGRLHLEWTDAPL